MGLWPGVGVDGGVRGDSGRAAGGAGLLTMPVWDAPVGPQGGVPSRNGCPGQRAPPKRSWPRVPGEEGSPGSGFRCVCVGAPLAGRWTEKSRRARAACLGRAFVLGIPAAASLSRCPG